MGFDDHFPELRDEDHAFSVRGRPVPPAEFFGLPPEPGVLAERAAILAQEPDALGLVPEGEPLVAAAADALAPLLPGAAWAGPPKAVLRALGAAWEPDLVLLARGEADWLTVGGAVAFPSLWSLPDKLGRPLEEVHGPVPGLNAALAPKIGRLLDRLTPGATWWRVNWSLSGGADRDQRPKRRGGWPALDPDRPADAFLRWESQLLWRLPAGGLLFAIRVRCRPLAEFQGTAAGRGLARQLRSMEPEMLAYKGLTRFAGPAAAWLEDAARA